jgi:hypothetical protein
VIASIVGWTLLSGRHHILNLLFAVLLGQTAGNDSD